jgi:ABC-type lipoprotein release transport system permease subunit
MRVILSMFGTFSSFFKTLVWDKSSFKFALGVWLGLSFSIAVILSTIGLMDGFVSSMRSGLKQSSGDLSFYSRSGFFTLEKESLRMLKDLGVKDLSASIETQAFIVHSETSKGISIKGINAASFERVTSKKLPIQKGSVVLGDELAEALGLTLGDEVVLVLAKGNKELEGLPLLKRFKVSGVIDHGIYQKDLRYVYMEKTDLSKMLGVGERVNLYSFNLPKSLEPEDESLRPAAIDSLRFKIEDILGIDFRVKPYWYDFSSLLEAVEIEKLTIGLILQVIVVISIFNVLSFVTFLNERKSREIFLFQALGMSSKRLRRTWLSLVLSLWVISCSFSLVFVKIFDFALGNLSVLQLPGDVYYLGSLKLSLDLGDYFLVFSGALVWLILIVAFALYRMNKRSVLHGLRKEFA